MIQSTRAENQTPADQVDARDSVSRVDPSGELRALLNDLRRQDIKVWLDGERVRMNAPAGALSPELRREIARRKAELVGLLKSVGPEELLEPAAPTGQLSFGQERLWFLDQLERSSALYNVPVAIRLRGPLDVGALRHSLDAVLARHAVLRSTFHTQDGAPVQVIGEPQPAALSIIDLRLQPAADREANLVRVLTTESRRRFDLSSGPLLRATLVQLADHDHALLITLHHIVCDGWSLGVLTRDVSELYDAFVANLPPALPALPIQYTDYAAWQHDRISGNELSRLVDYWRTQLKGAPLLFELPFDRTRPAVASGRGESVHFQLPEQLVSGLKDLSRTRGATLYMTLLAAYATQLSRYTGQPDLLVGSPIAGRSRTEFEDLVGLFVNTLALRVDLSGDPTFGELLGRVREMTLDADAHQALPFEKLVELLQPQRSLSHQPLVQVMFVFHNSLPQTHRPTDLRITPIDLQTGTAKADLNLALAENEQGLEGWLEYDAELFDHATMERFAEHYAVLLESIVAQPARRISELPLLREAERTQLQNGWNATQTGAYGELCLPQLVEAQVDRTPDATAVVALGKTLTYAELDEEANRIAHYLKGQGVERGSLVAISLDRTTDLLVALLGITKAGAGYVPLDPTYPAERRAFMLADSGARLLLTQRSLIDDLPLTDVRVVCINETDEQVAIASQSASRPSSVATLDDTAYVIYTSGSTGKPKGVAVPHRALANLLLATHATPGIAADDVVLAITTLAFDIAVFDLWSPLTVGARIELAPREAAADGALLLRSLHHSGATVLQATPSTWRLLIEAGWQGGTGLRVISTGEALARDLAEQLTLREQNVWNMYGPTETTVWSAYWRVPRAPTRILIGSPLANTRFYVLDPAGALAPIGVPGELYIGGQGVATGYLGRPELTAERFVPDRFADRSDTRMYRTGDLARWRSDGQVEYLGRNDQQVKLRGYRIELGEIEALLREHPLVRDTGVIVRESAPGDQRLTAYVVYAADGEPSPNELRTFLRTRLPPYMVPDSFVALDELPLTQNGKLDRNALPAAPVGAVTTSDGYVAPRDDVERSLVEMWEELLGHGPIGIHDNFFDVGGHSLLAARLVFRIKAKLNRNLPVATLISAATVAQLAILVKGPERDDIWDPLVELQAGEPGRRPLFFVHGAFGDVLCYTELARALGADQPCYVLQAIGLDGIRAPQERVEDMALAYIQEMRSVQPLGPYCLAGYSIGGTIVFEMARQLKEAGETIGLLAVFDHPPALGASVSRTAFGTYAYRFVRNLVTNIPYWARVVRNVERDRWSALLHERLGLLRRAVANMFSVDGPSVEQAMEEVEAANGLAYIEDWPAYRRRVLEFQFRAMRRYQLKPYVGQLLLFRARRQPLVSGHDPHLGWSELIRGPIAVVDVPGNHRDLLHQPHVEVLAASLRPMLRALAAVS